MAFNVFINDTFYIRARSWSECFIKQTGDKNVNVTSTKICHEAKMRLIIYSIISPNRNIRITAQNSKGSITPDSVLSLLGQY